MERQDKLNQLFDHKLGVPDVVTVALDIHNLDEINTDIVTCNNVWNVMVLMSLITKNSGACVFHREDVIFTNFATDDGKVILEKVRKRAIYLSGKREISTIDAVRDKSVVRCDGCNKMFNVTLGLPYLTCCAIDLHNIDRVDADIVTIDNVWNVMVLTSVLTSNTGACVMYRTEVDKSHYTDYAGERVLETVKPCARYLSSNLVDPTIETLLSHGYKACDGCAG